MSNNVILLAIIMCLFLSFCTNVSKNSNGNLDNGYNVINIDKLVLERSINFSSIFKSFRIIPLETIEACLIGNIDQVDVLDNEIYVLDAKNSKSLYVFNEEGKYMRKIGARGKGPGEYHTLFNFSIDKELKIVFILDPSLKKLIQYSTDGSFIKEFSLELTSRPIEVIVHDGYIYIDYFPTPNTKSENLLKKYDYNGTLISEFFKFPEYCHGFSEMLSTGFVFSRTNNDIKYCKPFSDTIFSINNRKISPWFAFMSDAAVAKNEIKNINSHKDILGTYFGYDGFKGASRIFECDNLFTFMFNNKLTHNYFYWKKNGETKIVNKVIDDMTFIEPVNMFIGSYENEFISYVPNWNMGKFISNIKSDSIMINEVDSKIFNELTINSNPVLLFYECREKLLLEEQTYVKTR